MNDMVNISNKNCFKEHNVSQMHATAILTLSIWNTELEWLQRPKQYPFTIKAMFMQVQITKTQPSLLKPTQQAILTKQTLFSLPILVKQNPT